MEKLTKALAGLTWNTYKRLYEKELSNQWRQEQSFVFGQERGAFRDCVS